MVVTYVLVLFVLSPVSEVYTPEVMEVPFENYTQCWNAGFTLKARNPKRIRWFNCERVPEPE